MLTASPFSWLLGLRFFLLLTLQLLGSSYPLCKRSPGIVTKASDKRLFVELSQQLTDVDEPFTGRSSEWSSGPYLSGVDACVCKLHQPEDRLALGLLVDVYRGTPPPENIESRDAEESDIDDFEPYISAIDDGNPTIELKALAIPAPGEEHDPESSSGSLKRFTNKPKVL